MKSNIVLGVNKITQGVKSNETIIVTDELTGHKQLANKIVEQVCYDSTKILRPWIALDLETGTRGWYPGCLTVCITGAVNSDLWTDTTATTLVAKVPINTELQIAEALDKNSARNIWYRVYVHNKIAYIAANNIKQIVYKDKLN